MVQLICGRPLRYKGYFVDLWLKREYLLNAKTVKKQGEFCKNLKGLTSNQGRQLRSRDSADKSHFILAKERKTNFQLTVKVPP